MSRLPILNIEAGMDLLEVGSPDPRSVPGVEIAVETTRQSATIIVDKMRQTKFVPRPHMRRRVVGLRDQISLNRAFRHDPCHVDQNDNNGKPRLPAWVGRIVDHTLAASARAAQ